MHIEHIAIWARDIEKLCAFYKEYFQAMISDRYTNTKKGFSSHFVSFGTGARIEIMHMDSVKDSERDPAANYMGLAHFAISLGSAEEVDRLTKRLKQDGHTVLDGPRRTGDGYYEAAILDPEGNRIEVVM